MEIYSSTSPQRQPPAPRPASSASKKGATRIDELFTKDPGAAAKGKFVCVQVGLVWFVIPFENRSYCLAVQNYQ